MAWQSVSLLPCDTVIASNLERSLLFTITDEGDGFDWKPYLEMSMERMMENHGRGIAMSRSISFASL